MTNLTPASSSTADASRPARMRWWHDARFGMFVHWGLYSQLGRGEWVMNLDRIPIPEYEPLADSWTPRPGVAREWAALARDAGMKYMVLTTKHHEGFCLWDTRQTDYNAVKRGPKRDLIREYVEACREFGLNVGFYSSLMDWHHPDGGVRLFLDGKPVHADGEQRKPATPLRARLPVELSAGTHEILLALDLNGGLGWGIFLRFAVPPGGCKPGEMPVFPGVLTTD